MFLDDEDFTPYTLDPDAIGEAAGYITDGLTGCYIQTIDDAPVACSCRPRWRWKSSTRRRK